MESLSAVVIVTGILVERHRIDPASARAMVERVAREHGMPEAELAAAVISLLAPAGPATTATAGAPPVLGDRREWSPAGGGPGEGTPGAEAPAELLVGAPGADGEDGGAVAQLLGELTGARPDRTVIYGTGAGALRMLGSVGTAEGVVRAWTTIPLVLDIPLCASVKEQRPVFLESGVEMEREYPATRGGREGTEAWASIPVVEEGQVVGVVGLSWQEPRTFDPATRERIIHAVESAGHALVRSLKAEAAELSMLNELLHLIPDPWLALRPTEGQATPTFLVEAVAPNLPQTWLGAHLLDLFDVGTTSELLTDLQRVLHHGRPLVRSITGTRRGAGSPGSALPGVPPWEEPGTELRIVRSGHHLVLTWR
jgi:hypothetical protein